MKHDYDRYYEKKDIIQISPVFRKLTAVYGEEGKEETYIRIPIIGMALIQVKEFCKPNPKSIATHHYIEYVTSTNGEETPSPWTSGISNFIGVERDGVKEFNTKGDGKK